MIRIIEGTPGAVGTVSWTDCKRNDIVISHHQERWLSRWTTVKRKRPFAVGSARTLGFFYSWHATLEAAQTAARRLATS